MIDHVGFPVSDLARSKAFYLKALDPLGIGLIMELSAKQTGSGSHCGFGAAGRPFFWIGDNRPPGACAHLAFAVPSRGQVQAFYDAALAAGGQDNGAPGLRPHYHSTYYGAFVLDPDGNNIEAVCHAPG
jgi:catechol 2,3-dioxygenase-like lactoylglutathione lyase family enzyme